METPLPQRIQRRRTKGYRMQEQSPDGRPVVSVCRPGKWGNPFRVGWYAGMVRKNYVEYWYEVSPTPTTNAPTLIATPEQAVAWCKQWFVLSDLNFEPLQGKHLACFCDLTAPCHADTLLELANDEMRLYFDRENRHRGPQTLAQREEHIAEMQRLYGGKSA
jgi:ribosomal protein L34